jgi:plasmid stability protein
VEVFVATLTVKNIPEDVYTELKRVAESNHRSINSEIIVCIERAVRSKRINPEAVLTRARQLREKTAQYVITDDEFNQAKAMGRP